MELACSERGGKKESIYLTEKSRKHPDCSHPQTLKNTDNFSHREGVNGISGIMITLANGLTILTSWPHERTETLYNGQRSVYAEIQEFLERPQNHSQVKFIQLLMAVSGQERTG
jgi:hypothetical protein